MLASPIAESRGVPSQLAGTPLKNRGRIGMVVDVLRTCQRGVHKSRLMLRANLNSVVATYLLSQLMAKRLVNESEEEGKALYQTTPLGNEFLKRYWELSSMLTEGLLPTSANDDWVDGVAF